MSRKNKKNRKNQNGQNNGNNQNVQNQALPVEETRMALDFERYLIGEYGDVIQKAYDNYLYQQSVFGGLEELRNTVTVVTAETEADKAQQEILQKALNTKQEAKQKKAAEKANAIKQREAKRIARRQYNLRCAFVFTFYVFPTCAMMMIAAQAIEKAFAG